MRNVSMKLRSFCVGRKTGSKGCKLVYVMPARPKGKLSIEWTEFDSRCICLVNAIFFRQKRSASSYIYASIWTGHEFLMATSLQSSSHQWIRNLLNEVQPSSIFQTSTILVSICLFLIFFFTNITYGCVDSKSSVDCYYAILLSDSERNLL